MERPIALPYLEPAGTGDSKYLHLEKKNNDIEDLPGITIAQAFGYSAPLLGRSEINIVLLYCGGKMRVVHLV